MIEFQLIDDTEDVEVNLIDNTDNIEVELIKEIDSYNPLKDKPSINNVTLTGNKTLHDLGIQQEGDYTTTTEFETRLAQKVDKVTGKGLSTNDYTTPEKNKLASLENYDDTEVRQLIDTKQPRGNYLTEETDPTVPNHVKTITQNNIANWNNKQEQLISGTNIKTINNTSILGSGNIEIEGGGSSDYSELTNKPSINNITLNGNKTSSDLGLQPAGNYVTNTDYATYNEGGVVKISVGDHGLNMDNGTLKGVVKTLAQYNDMSNKGVISKGTLENVIEGKGLVTSTDLASKQDITDNTLTTTNKTIPTAINEVNSIAKGANQAIGYSDYQTMITAINSLSGDEYNVGQNVYIVTVNVPDLWVSNVESTSSTYTYVDDATVINDLETNGYIQVGYYKLSMLETQKVDLTNYVKNTDYATSQKGGVIKCYNSDGLTTNNGTLITSTKTYAQYNSGGNWMFIGKGTLENVIAGKNLATKNDMPKYYYGTCATGASTRAKVVECEGFVLEEGATISVFFTNAQTYNGSPQLNVNGTGAIVVQYKGGSAGIRYMWSAGEIIDFTYDGTYWICHGRALATTTYYGITKLSNSAISTSTSLALTPAVINAVAENMITGYDAYSASKTYEVGDRVRYSSYSYECNTPITTAEAWTAAHWTPIDPLQTQIDALEARIKALENS